jgi:hypothetical protein
MLFVIYIYIILKFLSIRSETKSSIYYLREVRGGMLSKSGGMGVCSSKSGRKMESWGSVRRKWDKGSENFFGLKITEREWKEDSLVIRQRKWKEGSFMVSGRECSPKVREREWRDEAACSHRPSQ